MTAHSHSRVSGVMQDNPLFHDLAEKPIAEFEALRDIFRLEDEQIHWERGRNQPPNTAGQVNPAP